MPRYCISRGSPRAHPGITLAHIGSPLRHPTGGERRRPMLTRQNRKGNIAPSSPKFCPKEARSRASQAVISTHLHRVHIACVEPALRATRPRQVIRALPRVYTHLAQGKDDLPRRIFRTLLAQSRWRLGRSLYRLAADGHGQRWGGECHGTTRTAPRAIRVSSNCSLRRTVWTII